MNNETTLNFVYGFSKQEYKLVLPTELATKGIIYTQTPLGEVRLKITLERGKVVGKETVISFPRTNEDNTIVRIWKLKRLLQNGQI